MAEQKAEQRELRAEWKQRTEDRQAALAKAAENEPRRKEILTDHRQAAAVQAMRDRHEREGSFPKVREDFDSRANEPAKEQNNDRDEDRDR